MTLSVIFYSMLLGILPAILWLWLWLREDNLHPEPRLLIVISFIIGMISVVAAVILEKYAADLISDTTSRYIVWAFIEETVKFLAVIIIALSARSLDEPIDAMIYCITVALGFAALENALFIFSPLELGEVSKSIITGNMRFIGATLVHIVSSAVIGFFIGLAFYRKSFVQMISLVSGLILSSTLHASFNLSIISSSAIGTLKVFGWVWIAVIILIILFEEVKAVMPKYYRDVIH